MISFYGFTFPDKESIRNIESTYELAEDWLVSSFVDEKISIGQLLDRKLLPPEYKAEVLCNEDGRIRLIWCGSIVDLPDLKRALEKRGHIFKTNLSAEVLVHAYEEWQLKFLPQINGEFVFAIYDSCANSLILCRDRFGAVPIYYSTSNCRFIFSSKIKHVLSLCTTRQANEQLIFDFLCHNLLHHSSGTFFKDIFQVPRGHYLMYKFQTGDIQIQPWYLYHPIHSVDAIPENEKIELIRDTVSKAVECRLKSTGLPSVSLSGGLDSSLIAHFMRHLRPEERIMSLTANRLIISDQDAEYTDMVVKSEKLESKKALVSPNDLSRQILDLIITQEEPFSGATPFPDYKVMQLANENGIYTVLEGQAGDEIFGGYQHYFGYYFSELISRKKLGQLGRELAFYIRDHHRLLPFQLAAFLKMPPRIRHKILFRKRKWLSSDFYHTYNKQPASLQQDRWVVGKLIDAMWLDLTMCAIPSALIWVYKNASRWGVQTSMPFLDYRLVEMFYSFPPEDKLRNGQTKYIYRKAMSGLLPEKIVQRKDKAPLYIPGKEWFSDKKCFDFTLDILHSTKFKDRGYWNHKRLLKQLYMCRNNEGSSHSQFNIIWKCLITELWFRLFIDSQQLSQ